MFVGDETEGLGMLIVDSSGKVVARAVNVRMLAPGYSLRHGAKGGPMNPTAAARMTANYQRYMKNHPGLTDWTYGAHPTYNPVGQLPMNVLAQDAIRSSSGRLGQLPMNVLAQDALRSSSGTISGDGMFGQLPMRTLARDAIRSSSKLGDMFGWKYGGRATYSPVGQLPMNTVAQDALRSSSGTISGDEDMEGMEDMFGPAGEPSALF